MKIFANRVCYKEKVRFSPQNIQKFKGENKSNSEANHSTAMYFDKYIYYPLRKVQYQNKFNFYDTKPVGIFSI